MTGNDLEALIIKRKKFVEMQKENKFRFDVLTTQYSDQSHFIFEILQNAEDAYTDELHTKTVRFKLSTDRLDVYHDGKDFSLDDIDGVTGFGNSTKQNDLTAIGKFGIGFKSVYEITKTPYIFSGEYRIRIEDLVVPSLVDSDEQISGTLIRLPFNRDGQDCRDAYNLVAERLANIDLKTMLFLRNIERIQWETPNSSQYYSRSSENLPGFKKTRKVILESSSRREEYIVISRPIDIDGKELKVEVAYKLGKNKDGKEIIVSEHNSKLCVFFPTKTDTGLNFIIQAPLRTTPNRENIHWDDTYNKEILQQVGHLVADSLGIIKDLSYLNLDFMKNLLVEYSDKLKEREAIYPVIYGNVKKVLSNYLPTFDGRYLKANEVLLPGSKPITELLGGDDIRKLFQKIAWLSPEISNSDMFDLKWFLKTELKIQEVEFEDLAKAITSDFLQTKTDEWMISFYRQLLNHPALWRDKPFSPGVLRTKPIIRLDTDEHIVPFDESGDARVWLPSSIKSSYDTVKRSIAADKDAKLFLTQLGLREPDLRAEVEKFVLPKYSKQDPVKDDRYLEDLDKILKIYETIPSDQKEKFKQKLSYAAFIDSVHNGTSGHHLKRPHEVYFRHEELRKYFDQYDDVYFVANELYLQFGEERLKRILTELAVADKPRRIDIESRLTYHEKNKLRGSWSWTRDTFEQDYDWEGLDSFIRKMTVEKSLLLWKLLLESINQLPSHSAEDFFQGEYRWFYHKERSARFAAKFLKTLREREWLVDKNGILKKPADLTFSDLLDTYDDLTANSASILKRILNFKHDMMDQLPEDIRRTLKIVEGIPLEQLQRMKEEHERRKESERHERPNEPVEGWKPPQNPDAVSIHVEDVNPERIITSDLAEQEDKEDLEVEIPSKSIQEGDQDNEYGPIDRVSIGRWGEEYVYHALKDRFRKHGTIVETNSGFKVASTSCDEYEIRWKNKRSDTGIGYDFVILQDGCEVEYVEVKTKTDEKPEFIEITGAQWEFARKLFEQNEGEKYYVYVVLNAGENNPRIERLQNPTKLWREGKLVAHPVKFKLPPR
ncbi:DUF3883 domain-containing protein [Nitrososphaera sp.]|uniref:sacsin N-terminal ATP-binding-like domain-containing protein n=1 Tax=Nitrososphaera sp. TaxID=1971748 RepID=UPI00307D6158